MTKLLATLLGTTFLRAPDDEAGGGGGDDAAAAAAAATAAAAGKPAKPEPPAGLDAKYWDAEAGSLKAEDLVRDFSEAAKFRTENEARLAEIAAREAAVPADPAAYKVEFPKDAPVVDGFDFKIADDDPMLAAARTFAKKNGLSQEAFSELLGMRRALELAEFGALKDASSAVHKELGTQADQRVDAVEAYLKTTLGEDAMIQLTGVLFNKVQFEAVERLVALAQGASQTGYQGGGTQGRTETLSDEEWAKMSDSERLAYGRKHSPPVKKQSKAAA